MSSPFSVTIGTQQKAITINQIITAYNQRRAAVLQAPRTWTGTAWTDASTLISAGTRIQSADLIAEIQNWISTECGKWMPPTITTYHDTDPANFKRISVLAADAGQEDFEYFCKTIVAGGLASGSAYGFRRRLPNGTYTRGITQAGDYWTDQSAGWTAWDDVIECLSAMKITELSGAAGSYDTAIQNLDSSATNPEGYLRSVDQYGGMKAVAESTYNGDSPGSQNAGPPYADYSEFDPSYGYFAHSQSGAVKYYIYPDAESLISSIPLYFIAQARTAFANGFDAHGTGVIEGKLASVTDLPHTSSGEIESGILLQVPSFASFNPSPGRSGFESDTTSGTCWYGIVIWNFTNSN